MKLYNDLTLEYLKKYPNEFPLLSFYPSERRIDYRNYYWNYSKDIYNNLEAKVCDDCNEALDYFPYIHSGPSCRKGCIVYCPKCLKYKFFGINGC